MCIFGVARNKNQRLLHFLSDYVGLVYVTSRNLSQFDSKTSQTNGASSGTIRPINVKSKSEDFQRSNLFFCCREFERRSLLDQDKLLVKLSPSSLQHDDDDDVRRLREKQSERGNKQTALDASEDEHEDDIEERNLINNNTDSSETMLNFRRRYENEAAAVVPKSKQLSDSSFDMLSDSSSSNADDEAARIAELYSNISGPIDGRHRIKIKTEMKIPTRSNKQRPKLMDAQFFNQDRLTNDTPLTNNANQEPDLASFDFLNDYEENK